MTSSYITSGEFRREIEAALGRGLDAKAEPDDADEALAARLAAWPAALAAEVTTLVEMYNTLELPALCGLKTGAFCTYAEINGFDTDELLDMFRGSEPGAAAAMSALELYNAHGSPYVVLSPDGVGILDEDPCAYQSLGIPLEAFLSMLVAADAATRRDGLAVGRAIAAALVGERRAAELVRSVNENA